jgi:hypothetical protein
VKDWKIARLVQGLLYSVDSMTTRGASGLILHQHWQFMGAMEAVAGMLMFGISTAYVFQVLLLYCTHPGKAAQMIIDSA